MLKDVLFYTFAFIALINTIHFGLYIAGANFYDIRETLRKKKPHKKQRGLRPLLTLVIPAHNEEAGIVRTLESVRKNTYRKLQILVVDDASTDNTRGLVWRYINEHPHMNIQLVCMKKNVGKGEAMNYALRHFAKGDLLMTLDADSLLARRSINNAVKHFDDPNIVGMAANVRVLDDGSVLSIIQKFEHMIGYRSKKFYTLTNSEFIIGGVASTYRMDVIREAGYYDTDTQTEDIGLSMKLTSKGGNTHQKIIYASDVLALTEGVQSYKALFKQRYRWKLGMLQNLLKYKSMVGNPSSMYSKTLTYYRLPMAFTSEIILLVEPILLIYVTYLSIINKNPYALVGAYITITLYILWNLWPDEYLLRKSKIRLSFYAPFMYFMFYVMNAVQLVAVLRCIKNHKKVLRKVKTGGAWTSPARATN